MMRNNCAQTLTSSVFLVRCAGLHHTFMGKLLSSLSFLVYICLHVSIISCKEKIELCIMKESE